MHECPTCHRPFESKCKLCFSCSRPIKRHHKWHIVGSYIVHDDCANPEMNLTQETPLLMQSQEKLSTGAE
jgi:hypothetical protein